MCGAMQNVTSVKPGGHGHHQLLRRLKNGTGEQEMKQTFLLRNEAIRNNAIDAILSLPIDDKSPHEVHVKEPRR
ncbi:TPA: recombination protein NinB, partial [Escherichia coli]